MGTSAQASADIHAPLDAVWRVMTDLPRYGEWNPFVVSADGPAVAVGSVLRLRVRWEGGASGARATVTVSRVEPPTTDAAGVTRATLEYRLSDALARLSLVRSVRTQTLTQAPGGPTRYETSERFEGLLWRFIPRVKVQRGFEIHAAALKVRAERGG